MTIPAPNPNSGLADVGRRWAPPYSIGSDHLPGLSKLVEELGELQQVLGKIMAVGEIGKHFDGSDLHDRTEEEIADVLAAIVFFVNHSDRLHWKEIRRRQGEKEELFDRWDDEQRGTS